MISGLFGWGEAGWGESGAAPIEEPAEDTAQWSRGSINLTQESPMVAGIGTQWDGNVAPGSLLVVQIPDMLESAAVYEISEVLDDETLMLAAPWAGPSRGGAPYLAHRRLGSWPRLHRDDDGIAPLMTYTLAKIDVELAIGVRAPPPPVFDWILEAGVWNDDGAWDDTATWQDS